MVITKVNTAGKIILLVMLGAVGAVLGAFFPSLMTRQPAAVLTEEVPGDLTTESQPTVPPAPPIRKIFSPAPDIVTVQREPSTYRESAVDTETRTWSADHDRFAEIIEQQQAQSQRSLVAVGGLSAEDASPRFILNLAISLVRRGSTVLLIDADVHTHELTDIFEMPVSPGFSSYGQNGTSLAEMIRETQLPGLRFMSSGLESTNNTIVTNSDDLRSSAEIVLLYLPGLMTETASVHPYLGLADLLLVCSRTKRGLGSKIERLTRPVPGIEVLPVALLK
jgi:hypothetical protein